MIESSTEFQQFLVIIAQFLNEIQSENVPFFFFGWIELVRSKHLLSHFVANSSLWCIYSSLVILRFLLVLLHKFSDFLSYYALNLCDSIPHFCIQYRNLILSAFSKDLKLLDPFWQMCIDRFCSRKSKESIFFPKIGQIVLLQLFSWFVM